MNGERVGDLRVSPLGAGVLLFEAKPPLSHAIQQRVWQIAALAAGWPGVEEAVPGMNNLMLVFDPLALDGAVLQRRVLQSWCGIADASRSGSTIVLPVVYGGEAGPDLDHVARHAGLTAGEVVALHAAGRYTVYCLGAHPGFGYLGGLDPRLHTPRRERPRVRVAAGSVAIGGQQTGVIAQVSPSGWQIIGRTDTRFFDPSCSPPTLLAPGDAVEFRSVKELP